MLEESCEYAERYFFTPTALEKAGGLWLVRLGRNIAKPNYHIGPRYVPYYSLHFVIDGYGVFQQEDATYDLAKGDVFCIFPKRKHQYFTDANKPLRMIWVALDGKQLIPLLNRIGLRPSSSFLPSVMNEEIVQLLEELFRHNGQHDPYEDLGKLTMLYRLFQALAAVHTDKDDGGEEETFPWLKRGQQFLQMHFMEGITIEEAAHNAGVNRTYFSKKFHEHYGMSPVKYLQSLRMNEAVRMLKETELKLTEIALSVGFPDLYSFSKAFKKQYQVSPFLFRKQNVE
ncbi:AraC family transcriptional regulator [Paenibacillus cremeus]|nr:AraC family transcriptional regulator [Paenibacillus cremeus]